MAKVKIAEATGIASGSMKGGDGMPLSKRIEAAMADAVAKAAEEGISADHPEKLRERMMAARQKVKADYRVEQEEARRLAEEAAAPEGG